jgi:predicted ATPase
LYALEQFPHRVVDMALGPLSEDACEELLAMLMPDGLEEATRAELIARSEGNPLYLEELLRAVQENGGLERRQNTWAFTAVPGRLLPPALESLLMSRMDRLSEAARRLAQVAAVIGRTFPAQVLEQVSGSEDYDSGLPVLLRAQFILELHRSPQLVYTFKHGLLHEAALSTLTPARRQEIYGSVAAVFEELYAESRDVNLEMLAYYYARSRNFAKACRYLELAGEKAASVNAVAHAQELWQRALKLARELGDADAEQRLSARARSAV